MKYMFRIGLMLFVGLAASSVVASQWDAYSQFMDNFYHLDDQKFNNISCGISVSLLDNTLAHLKTQLKALEGKLEIEESVSEFRLNYNRHEGLTFQLPSFDVRLISEDEIKDRNKVETGIKMMKQGFQHQVDGAVQMIEGIFKSYLSPCKKDVKIKQLSIGPDETTIIYEESGNTGTDIYSGKTCKSKVTGAFGQIESDIRYATTGKKLIIESADICIEQGMSTSTSKVVVEYQTVGSIILPKRIRTTTKQVMQGLQQQGQFDITFTDCKID